MKVPEPTRVVVMRYAMPYVPNSRLICPIYWSSHPFFSVNVGTTEISNTPVFGCALFSDAASDNLKDPRNVNQSK